MTRKFADVKIKYVNNGYADTPTKIIWDGEEYVGKL